MQAATNMAKKPKEWVSDLIGNQYKEWNGKKILINAGTGRGKTQFVLEKYCKWLQTENKNVLYICNRTELKHQIELNVKKYELKNVAVATYQNMSERIERGIPFNYDVFVLDEAHSLLTEASYNFTTDIIYDFLLRQNAVVYMSGTAKHIFNLIKKDIHAEQIQEYILGLEYSHVEYVASYESHNDIEYILEHIKPERKTVCFINDMTRLRKLYDSLSELGRTVSVYTSSHAKDKWFRNKIGNALIESNHGGYTFATNVLLCTSALDNGISLKDEAIGYIIVDIPDIETAIQCMGRKRPLSSNDKVRIFIRNWKSYNFNSRISSINKELAAVEKLQKHKALTRTEAKFPSVFFDERKGCLNFNRMRTEKLDYDLKMMMQIHNRETTYKDELLKYMGKENDKRFMRSLSEYQDSEKSKGILGWVSSHTGYPLTIEEEQELKEISGMKQIGKIRQHIGELEMRTEPYKPIHDLKSKIFYIQGKTERRWIIDLQK